MNGTLSSGVQPRTPVAGVRTQRCSALSGRCVVAQRQSSGACAPAAPHQQQQHPQQQQQLRRARGVLAGSASGAQAAGATQAGDNHENRRFHEGVTMTAYEGNSFAVKFNQSGVRVLVDPWLVDDLTFFEQGWAYRGKKRVLGPGRLNMDEVAAETDVILLSQYLDDHCHMPTLARLPKDIPIIAQPEAAARIAPLGFTNVTTLSPGGELAAAGGKLRVRGTAGALVGPPWSARQLGFVLREEGVPRPASLYYEPHCDFDEASVRAVGCVDVVVSPVVDVLLGGYALVKGSSDLAKLLRLLRPSVLVPLLNAELDEEGGLTSLMSRKGEVAGIRDALAAAGLGAVDVDIPAPPGEAFAIAL